MRILKDISLVHGVRDLLRREGGLLLVETVVAVMVFALVGTAVLSGLSTSKIAGAKTEGQSIGENIARNQMEATLKEPYQGPSGSYTSVLTPSGYAVTAVTEEFVLGDSNLEKIVVTVTHQAETVFVLETLRTLN